MNKTLKEKQTNPIKQVKAFKNKNKTKQDPKTKTPKTLNDFQDKTTKKVMEIDKCASPERGNREHKLKESWR